MSNIEFIPRLKTSSIIDLLKCEHVHLAISTTCRPTVRTFFDVHHKDRKMRSERVSLSNIHTINVKSLFVYRVSVPRARLDIHFPRAVSLFYLPDNVNIVGQILAQKLFHNEIGLNAFSGRYWISIKSGNWLWRYLLDLKAFRTWICFQALVVLRWKTSEEHKIHKE